MRALVLGATGMTGSLLLRLLCKHEKVSTLTAFSTSREGAFIEDEFVLSYTQKLTNTTYIGLDQIKNEYDVIFSALPHGVSAAIYQKIVKLMRLESPMKDSTININEALPAHHPLNQDAPRVKTPFVYIDLSADFRFSDIEKYFEVYSDASFEKNAFLSRAYSTACYGISELNREKISSANIIACPGCYPTSILLPLIPILKYVAVQGNISISSISGISGAGNNPHPQNMFCARTESLQAYKIGRTHRHYHEMKYQMNELAYVSPDFTFSPQLAPLAQGMLSTIHIPMDNEDIDRALNALNAQYIEEKFISIYPNNVSEIDTQKVRSTNNMRIATHKEDHMLIICACIDNLWKGAAGQAIQNFNIRFNFEETCGLEFFSS